MEMKLQSILDNPHKRPIIIAGPCSAETEEQVLQTARDLAPQNIDLFRAGIWKPRTRPGSFEGVGTPGLKWLKKVKEETGMKVTTEVAKAEHVYQAIKHNIDVLWIGARTTVNPFSVQEVADAIEGVDIPVLIKNPINPDLGLWVGAIERIYKAGVTKIGVIHRGFSYHGDTPFRNVPRWQIAIELKRRFPDLVMICDNSHICGRRDTLFEVAQQAMDLNYDGIMTEVHPTPDDAWSDAKQQITPAQFQELVNNLVFRDATTDDIEFLETLDHLRKEIDHIDNELFNLLGHRMELADSIGQYKKRNNISILQTTRWNEILEKTIALGQAKGLSQEFVTTVLRAIHQESINHQEAVMSAEESKIGG
ncbi:bifunctional 3-deoxy-7-phosphoheptulonate synthase/chorismate mutase type II [Flavilitoribacter nigricans]|uniref:chorismate mutase n=1 Tax=Flavilitoribacter nigricans (strain ATCC 23147 / DSM 23189 / NBRC 102662 / NCIMB 1420 / SS-2) TaxID=1122177 RepID=A0A2D0MYT0_FLAN2|nr:bifunctional 3-deoxy-7-phosphoheptulonate synthase/chorismate mutase type II [Flavilitoribacter nigricans]PHN01442.1 3-deoxy-7-phosphoheptulonate synthase [Flavilitoribacter nigricans DSM 23189 = NBRC 102662]